LSVEIENGGSFVEVVSGFLKKKKFLAIAVSKPAKSWIFFDHFCIFVVIAMKEESSGLRLVFEGSKS